MKRSLIPIGILAALFLLMSPALKLWLGPEPSIHGVGPDADEGGGGSSGEGAKESGDQSAPSSVHSRTGAVAVLNSFSQEGESFEAVNFRFRQWIGRHIEGQASGRIVSKEWVEDGRLIAQARRPLMLALMKSDPARALAESLRWHEWEALPLEIQRFVEKPFSDVVDFSHSPVCGSVGGKGIQSPEYRVNVGGEWFETSVFGRRLKTSSERGIPAQGIRLGERMVMWEDGVRRLSGQELAAARKYLGEGNARDRSWLTGEVIAGSGLAAEVGGRIHYFASEAEIASLNRAFAAAQDLPGPYAVQHAKTAGTLIREGREVFDLPTFRTASLQAASSWTETPKSAVFLRFDFTPRVGSAYGYEELLGVARTASDSIREMSYGKTWIDPVVSNQILVLPRSRNYYATQPGNVRIDAAHAAALSAGYELSEDIIVYSFNFQGAALAWGGNRIELHNVNGASTLVHELGHVYGLGHAGFWRTVTGNGFAGHGPADRPYELSEYGDPHDTMGFDSGTLYDGTALFPKGHFGVHSKAYLNWIENSEVYTVTTNGVYRIHRFDHRDARMNRERKLAMRIHGGENDEIWVGFRRNFLSMPSLAAGANIVWAAGPMWHYAVAANPLSHSNVGDGVELQDIGLPLFTTWTVPSGAFKITTLGWSGLSSADEYLDVQVEFQRPGFELFTTASATTPGLLGSYVNESLRGRIQQENWIGNANVRIAARRLDARVHFPTASAWGVRPPGITGGTDGDWENFSVQWDGFIRVNDPLVLATKSDDGSRLWIDLNQDGNFGVSAPELVNNGWGTGQGTTVGAYSGTIPKGLYRIRIQYEEGCCENTFSLVSSRVGFEFVTESAGQTSGLRGSYVNRNLRGLKSGNWIGNPAVSIASARVDHPMMFFGTDWGGRSGLGLTGGTSNDWDSFSVQWDGYLKVHQWTRFGTVSDDSSRLWIDLNGNGELGGIFESAELIDNNWGSGQGFGLGSVSEAVAPGTYRVRAQYEEGEGENAFFIAGGETESPLTSPAGFALGFDGGDEVVAVGGGEVLSGPRTIEAWVFPLAHEGLGTPIFSGGIPGAGDVLGIAGTTGDCNVGQYELYLDHWGTGCLDSNMRVNINAWNHVAMSYDGSTVRFYVNGVPGTEIVRGLYDYQLDTIKIGGNLLGGTTSQKSFYGKIDEVRIWNVARTAGEIFAGYRCSFPGSAAGLVGNWHFDEGIGSDVRDFSEANRTGTLRNGVAWVKSEALIYRGLSTLVANTLDDGVGSLRQAVCAAIASPGPDQIVFEPGMSGSVVRLTSGPIDLSDSNPIRISAAGLPLGVAISGEFRSRVFHVHPGTSVYLDSLTISNGLVSFSNGQSALGGAVYNLGDLSISNCVFAFNAVQSSLRFAHGGAIANVRGKLDVWQSTFYENSASGWSCYGGAIDSEGGQVSLRHCTLTGNRAVNAVQFSSGGALSLFGSAHIHLGHSIIADNQGGQRPNENEIYQLLGTVVSEGWNLIGNGSGVASLVDGVGGDQVGSKDNPIRPWLGRFGADPSTRASCVPLGGSPARDAGDPALSVPPILDARGYRRIVNGRIDIGATETELLAFFDFDEETAKDWVGTISRVNNAGCGWRWVTDYRARTLSALELNSACPKGIVMESGAHPRDTVRDLGLSGSFTVALWCRMDALTGDRMVVAGSRDGNPGVLGLALGLRNGRILFGMNGIELLGKTSVPLSVWTHLAWVYDSHGGLKACYVNGRLDVSAVRQTNSVAADTLTVGGSQSVAARLDGRIDDLAFFGAALSPNQIAAIARERVLPHRRLPDPSIELPAAPLCTWTVREVWAHPTALGNLTAAEYVAGTPDLGRSISYESSTISREDPQNPGARGFFPGASPYLSNNQTPQGLISGDDNFFVLAASTVLEIVDEDDYTFGFSSDDGGRLRVKGANFVTSVSAYGGNPATPAHQGDVLSFAAPTALSDTLGVTHLRPGRYEVEFVTWEDAGGAFSEVFVAKGAKLSLDATFSLLHPNMMVVPRLSYRYRDLGAPFPIQLGLEWSPSNDCQRLQCAPTPTGPWTNCDSSANPQILTLSRRVTLFFRVVQQ